MAKNTLSPQHQVDDSGETLLAVVTRLGLHDHVLDELGRYPEAAGEILLEEVGGNRRDSSEHPEWAIRTLDALMAHAPQVEDRQYAATEKLEILFEEGGAEANTEAERLICDLTTPRVLQEGRPVFWPTCWPTRVTWKPRCTATTSPRESS